MSEYIEGTTIPNFCQKGGRKLWATWENVRNEIGGQRRSQGKEPAAMDIPLDVVGYLLQGEFFCRECVEKVFTGDMELFWADRPTSLTQEDVLRLGRPLCVTCVEEGCEDQ